MPIRVYYEVLNQKGTPALYSDNYASRPAAGYTGRIFYSPDTAQIFYDTGSTWTLLADAGVGSGSLASVCANGNTTATGISITAGGLSTNSLTSTNLTAGSIPFIGTGGLFSQDNTNLFWDNTNKYLGINTNNPTAPFDVHITGNIGIQINNTTTANSMLAFLNADVGKWRIGNVYQGGVNAFGIYNNSLSAYAMSIDPTSQVTFVASVTASSLISGNGLKLANGSYSGNTGFTGIGGQANGLAIVLSDTSVIQLNFPTGTKTYTYPNGASTLIGTAVGQSTDNIPKWSSTSGLVTASMLSDDGTTVTSAGASRSNLYIKAINNTYYGQLAFTNGSNGNYGGISYNNANQYMQFETASSEWMRLMSDGNLGINTTSPTQIGGYTGISINNTSSGALLDLMNSNSANLRLLTLSSSDQRIYANGSLSLYTNSNSRLNINTSGKVTINEASSTDTLVSYGSGNNWAIAAQGSTTTNQSYGLVSEAGTSASDISFLVRNTSGTQYLKVRGDGYIITSAVTYNNSSAAASNMILYASYDIGRSTSSIRFKTQIEDIDQKYIDNIYKMRPRWYRSLCEKDNKEWSHYGFIAEEMAEIDPRFVHWNIDENGNQIADGVQYDRLTALLTMSVQQLNDRVTALENKLN